MVGAAAGAAVGESPDCGVAAAEETRGGTTGGSWELLLKGFALAGEFEEFWPKLVARGGPGARFPVNGLVCKGLVGATDDAKGFGFLGTSEKVGGRTRFEGCPKVVD